MAPLLSYGLLVALPVFNAAYLGVAEAARDLALKLAARKKNDPVTPLLVGEMENQLVTAQLAHASMVQMVSSESPSAATSAAVMVRRTIFGNAALRTVEKAMEVAGGASFYRTVGLERLFRDVQAVRFHPLQEKAAATLHWAGLAQPRYRLAAKGSTKLLACLRAP